MPGTDEAIPPQRRRRDPVRTRALILAAATAEFAGRGLDGASVNSIADAAGVNKRMLYHYFASKDGLYRAVLDATLHRLAEMLSTLDFDAVSPRDAIAALVTALFDHVSEHPEVVRLTSIENMTEARQAAASSALPGLLTPLLAALAKTLARGEAAGAFRPCDPLQVFMTLAAMATTQVSNRATTAVLVGVDPMTAGALAARRRHVVEFALAALRP